MTKAVLHYSGKVTWNPPAIYKSSCEIDVEFFPFDEQKCHMKFGSWTYDGFTVDLRHIHQKVGNNRVNVGMDLQEYYISTEWDIMTAPAVRNENFYTCCEEPYPDIIFYLTLRRKSLFYTVNVIIPCVGISFLSVLVFYLPSDSGEKVSLSISILLSLTVFFLLLAEIIPSTSITVPLLGKYLLFTMILVTFSVVVTIGVLNVNFRTPATHKMAPWVRRAFVDFLPRFLFIQRPEREDDPILFEDEKKDKKLPMSHSLTTTQEDTDDDIGNHYGTINSNTKQQPLQQLQLHAPSCDGSGRDIEYTNYAALGTGNPHHLLVPSQDGPCGNGTNHFPHAISQNTPTSLSSPWHPHPPSMHGPPMVPPHHHSPAQQQHLQHHDNIVALNDDLNDESATSDLATSFFGYR